MADAQDAAQAEDFRETDIYKNQVGTPYSWYVLGVFVLVYVINFIDRNILSILAEDIRRDLNVSDAELGFLYGTAFAVFYALFAIPLGRLADLWVRRKLMALGLALWSSMTVLSGFCTNFTQIAAARIGVGIGEASASPCAYSMLGDYFPREKRATVLALYSTGIYLGGGISLLIGGLVSRKWTEAFPLASDAPLHLAGWQAAFIAVGLPGLLLALVVAAVREPIRGISDGQQIAPDPAPWPKFFDELQSIIPPFTLLRIYRLGGMRALGRNMALAGGIALLSAVMIALTQTPAQWIAVGIGAYAVASWAQGLKHSDPPAFALIWGTPSFVLAVLCFGLISFNGYSIGYWVAPYVERTFGIEKSVIGFFIGGSSALGGLVGVFIGGWLADRLRLRSPTGRLWVALAAVVVPIPLIYVEFTTRSPALIFVLNLPVMGLGSMWLGVGAATTQDLVLPRMRGIASATYFVGITMIGLALGPYYTGYVSKMTGSLSTGILALYAALPLVLLCLWQLWRRLPAAEATRIARAQAAGETL